MPCRYCGERDPLKLSIRTRFADGRVETIEICLDCYWLDRFRTGENGNLLQFEETVLQEAIRKRKPSALRERFNSRRKG